MLSTPSTQPAALPESARTIARRLGQALQPDAIYLFGSHARGEAGPDSDLDFLVVVPASRQTRLARNVAARRAVSDIPVPKDILVLTREEWADEAQVACSLVSTVVREGIRLYE